MGSARCYAAGQQAGVVEVGLQLVRTNPMGSLTWRPAKHHRVSHPGRESGCG
jgi:hypothetical protein